MNGAGASFAMRQVSSPFGPLSPLTRAAALSATRDWAKPPTDSMLWRRFNRMGTISYLTARGHFPCRQFGHSGTCLHVDGVRGFLGISPIQDPMDRKLTPKFQREEKNTSGSSVRIQPRSEVQEMRATTHGHSHTALKQLHVRTG